MSNPASSFRADESQPWHRHRWPWLLMIGPLAVVVACAASAWMAASSDDGVVAQDYYKQGLLINRKLKSADPQAVPEPRASLSVTGDGRIHVRLADAAICPERLQLALTRPGERSGARRVDLAMAGDEWVGPLPELAPGRWIVALESERWQLPITVVAVPFTEITLGGGSPHS